MSERLDGIGIGFRGEMAEEVLQQKPAEVKFLEIHPENYMLRGGRYPAILKQAMERWPIVTHGLTMCFGAVQRYEREYLDPLEAFLSDVGTQWHSDHMCFAGEGAFVHDLLPLPFNEEAAQTVASRLEEARDHLGLPLAIENVSYYAPSDASETDEASFVLDVLERADAKILLDVNNVYVNSRNFGFDPKEWLDRIPAERVVQIHVAGHLVRPDGFRIDTHAEDVCDDVYELLGYTIERIGPKPVLLERDGNYPPLAELLEQVRRLDDIYRKAVRVHEERERGADRAAGRL